MNLFLRKYYLIICYATLCIWGSSCNKTDYIESADASISVVDKISFDTVFTQIGSATQIFKIFNTNKQTLRINQITLAGGSNSAYQINVNGKTGTQFSNLDIDAGDSIYGFVRVNIDPTSQNTPFLVRDSIAIAYNGKVQQVQLEAYGQNAIYLSDNVITKDTVWKKDLPIVLLKSITIPEGKTLTIEKGSQIYCHDKVSIFVKGHFLAQGDTAQKDRIQFTTDRLDYVDNITNTGGVSYKNLAGAWSGIDFDANSAGNILNYVTIKNSIYAITDTLNTTVSSTPKLNIAGCIIQNNSGFGILSHLGNMVVTNSLIANNGSAIGMYGGGQYSLNFNTLVGYSNVYVSHNNPVLYLGGTSSFDFNVSISNSILWGDNAFLNNEIGIGSNFGDNKVAVSIRYSLAKYTTLPTTIALTNTLQNVDPSFVTIDNDKAYYDFHLQSNSPCSGAAIPITGILYDLSGNKRNTLKPSMGCYENL